jgi:hypothetical protein
MLIGGYLEGLATILSQTFSLPFQHQLGTNTNAIKFKIMSDEMEDKVCIA